jgi:L-alanine-DL-glutamate epimerase-like enolase superfamily enzyme
VRIKSIALGPVLMRKTDPTWRFALAASPTTDGFLVTIRSDDDLEGFGYASAIPHIGAPTEVVARGLDALGAALLGADAEDLAGCLAIVAARDAANPARAAMDMALHDIAAKGRGVPLYQLLGTKVRSEVAVLRILAIKRPQDMSLAAAGLVAEGYRYLKIKLDGNVEEDAARVRAIRETVGAHIVLTVDANQSYRVADAIRVAALLEPLGVILFEQPVVADDLAGLAEVSRATSITVEADESAASLDDVRRLVDKRAVGSISLKLPKLGGLRAAAAAAELCRQGGVSCRVGAHVGTRLLAAAALHFAAATAEVGDVAELGEFVRLLDDPAEGLEVDRGRLRVPETPGIGVRLRAGSMAR